MVHIHPHIGFLNTDFRITSDTPCNISITYRKFDNLDEVDDLAKNPITYHLQNGKTIQHQFHYAGEYVIKNSLDYTEEVVTVKDAIKLGGSTHKASYVFEGTPWVFVVMKDRTYFHNRDTEEEYVESISPDSIEFVNADVVLMGNEAHNEYSLYSLTFHKPIYQFNKHIYLDADNVVTIQEEEEKLIVLSVCKIHSDKVESVSFECLHYSIDKQRRCAYFVQNDIVNEVLFSTLDRRELMELNNRILCFTNSNYIVTYQDLKKEKCINICNVCNKSCIERITSQYPIASVEGTIIEEIDAINKEFNQIVEYVSENKLNQYTNITSTYATIKNIIIVNDIVYYLINTTTLSVDKNGNARTQEVLKFKSHKSEVEVELCPYYYSNPKVFDLNGLYLIESRGNPKRCLLVNEQGVLIDISDYTPHVFKQNVLFSKATKNDNKKEELYLYYRPTSKLSSATIGEFNWLYFPEFGVLQDKSNHRRFLFFEGNSLYAKLCSNDGFLNGINTPTPYHPIPILHFGRENLVIGNTMLHSKNIMFPERYDNVSEDLSFVVARNGSHMVLYKAKKECDKISFTQKEILKGLFDSSEYGNVLLSDNGENILYQKGEELTFMNLRTEQTEVFPNQHFITHVNGNRPLFKVDEHRRARLFDPSSQTEVDPDYFINYRFVSPDHTLYADTRITEYNNIIKFPLSENETKITQTAYQIYKSMYNIKEKRKEFIQQHIEYFNNIEDFDTDLAINDHEYFTNSFILSCAIAKIHSTQTDEIIAEIELGPELWFLNYVSFSYDSRYVAIAGRYPDDSEYSGLFLVYDLFNRKEVIRVTDSYAIWRTAFTQYGLVASYSSTPTTYLQDLTKLNKSLIGEDSLPKIEGKNFLAFSPDGALMALSKQGYVCYNGIGNNWGHQPSTEVFVYTADTLIEVATYNDLPDVEIGGIKESQTTAAVSFSMDNKKLMMVGKDGTVVIRNLHLNL